MSRLQEFRSQVPTENLVIQVLRALNRKFKLGTRLPNVTGRTLQDEYALEPEQVNSSLWPTMNELLTWMIDPPAEYQDIQNLVSRDIALNRLNVLYRYLGWLVKYKKIPWEALSLSHIIEFVPIKSAYAKCISYEEGTRIQRIAEIAAENTLRQINEFFAWKEKERQVNKRTLLFEIEAFIETAQFLYRDETNRFNGFDYSDIPVLVLLKNKRQKLKEEAQNAPLAADISLKWLEWDDFVHFVKQLELECRPQYNANKRRTLRAIARSYRRFLICAFLCYLPPDRQRTFRELQEGKTLVKGYFQGRFFQNSKDGEWYIYLGEGDYKTDQTYGNSFKKIPDLLVPYLEKWLEQYRTVFNPTHNYVFTQENGKPFTKASNFSAIIRHAAYRLTGQLLHSHLIRHMLVTHLKRLKVSKDLQESVALSMHHSGATQDSYDQRSCFEKELPAQQLMLSLAMGSPLSSHPEDLSVDELYTILRKLPLEDFDRLMAMLGR